MALLEPVRNAKGQQCTYGRHRLAREEGTKLGRRRDAGDALEFSAIACRRQTRHALEDTAERGGVVVADRLADVIDGHVVPFRRFPL